MDKGVNPLSPGPPSYATEQGYQQPEAYNQYSPAGNPGYYPPPQQPVVPGPYNQPLSGNVRYYPAPTYYAPPAGQQQQQQQTVIIGAFAPTVIQPRAYQSFVGYIVLSCFVFWCCGCLFGLTAFILAVVAGRTSQSGDNETATKLGKASLGVSVAGIVVGCIIIAIAVGLGVTQAQRTINSRNSGNYVSYCYNTYYGYYQCN